MVAPILPFFASARNYQMADECHKPKTRFLTFGENLAFVCILV